MLRQICPSRRHFIAAAAAAAALESIPVSGGSLQETRLSQDKLDALISEQRGIVKHVLIPSAPHPLRVDGNILVPPGVIISFNRNIVGDMNSSISLSDNTSINFNKSSVINVSINLLSGSSSIFGLRYSGHSHLAAINICGPGPYHNLKIEDFIIDSANYGILRFGASSSLNGAIIRNGSFHNILGDGIEWNVCTKDNGVLIEDIEICGIDAPPGKPFWGIGIGFSGNIYTKDWNDLDSVKGFIIRRIKGRSLNQLIHVEAGRNFIVEDVSGSDIAANYSGKSGLETGAVVCYGCKDFIIKNIEADARIFIASGVSRGKYVVPCSDFDISSVKLSGGDLHVEVGGVNSYAKIKGIKLSAGSLRIYGAAKRLLLSDVDITSVNRSTLPWIINKDFLSGTLESFRPYSPTTVGSRLAFRRGPS